MSYVSLETFKSYLKVDRGSDFADDSLLQAALDSAEAAINEVCQRQFVVAAGPATARSYTPSGTSGLYVHDFTSLTGITNAGTTVNPAEYQLEPLNSLSPAGQPIPYTTVRRYFGWWQPANPGQAIIVVTAVWGWTAIPVQVVEACKILGRDVLANRDISFGLASFTEYGVKVKENPQVMALLRPFRRVASYGIA